MINSRNTSILWKHIKITTNLIVEIITIITTILNLDKSILYGCFSDKIKMNKNKDNNKSREKSVRKTKQTTNILTH